MLRIHVQTLRRVLSIARPLLSGGAAWNPSGPVGSVVISPEGLITILGGWGKMTYTASPTEMQVTNAFQSLPLPFTLLDHMLKRLPTPGDTMAVLRLRDGQVEVQVPLDFQAKGGKRAFQSRLQAYLPLYPGEEPPVPALRGRGIRHFAGTDFQALVEALRRAQSLRPSEITLHLGPEETGVQVLHAHYLFQSFIPHTENTGGEEVAHLPPEAVKALLDAVRMGGEEIALKKGETIHAQVGPFRFIFPLKETAQVNLEPILAAQHLALSQPTPTLALVPDLAPFYTALSLSTPFETFHRYASGAAALFVSLYPEPPESMRMVASAVTDTGQPITSAFEMVIPARTSQARPITVSASVLRNAPRLFPAGRSPQLRLDYLNHTLRHPMLMLSSRESYDDDDTGAQYEVQYRFTLGAVNADAL